MRPALSVVVYWDCPVSNLDPANAHDQVLRELFLRYIDLPYALGGEGGLRHYDRDDGDDVRSSGSGSGKLSSKDFRNLSLKVIPHVAAGSWMVKQAVDDGAPHRLGKHLTVRYFRGINYVEADVDLASSVMAREVSSMLLRDSAKGQLTIDLALYLEGSRHILGAVRFHNLNPRAAQSLFPPSPGGGVVSGIGGDGEMPFAKAEVRRLFRDSKATQRFKVRGASYLLDKTKVAASEAFASLVHVGLYELPQRRGMAGAGGGGGGGGGGVGGGVAGTGRVDHVAAAVGTAAAAMTRRLLAAYGADHELLILNVQQPTALAVVWWAVPTLQGLDPGSLSLEQKRFLELWWRFMDLPVCGAGQGGGDVSAAALLASGGGDGDLADNYERQKREGRLFDGELPDDDFRVQRLKMFVSVNKGPWMVRTAVDTSRDQPLLLAKRLKTRFFRGEGYLEADVDLTSSVPAFSAASHVTQCRDV
ncbi:unnamed protein product, partial [Phaeothamnion confervicola]